MIYSSDCSGLAFPQTCLLLVKEGVNSRCEELEDATVEAFADNGLQSDASAVVLVIKVTFLW